VPVFGIGWVLGYWMDVRLKTPRDRDHSDVGWHAGLDGIRQCSLENRNNPDQHARNKPGECRFGQFGNPGERDQAPCLRDQQ
jgi:hypothetical protein